MFTETNNSGYLPGELDISSRIFRGILGLGFIAYVMSSPATPLGWLAVLPLIAIVPIFTAVTGWDPLYAFLQNKTVAKHALNYSPAARTILIIFGILAIGSAYFVHEINGVIGYWAIFPLAAVYPLFSAIIGQDPLVALYNLDNVQDRQPEERTLRVIEHKARKVDNTATDYHRAA